MWLTKMKGGFLIIFFYSYLASGIQHLRSWLLMLVAAATAAVAVAAMYKYKYICILPPPLAYLKYNSAPGELSSS